MTVTLIAKGVPVGLREGRPAIPRPHAGLRRHRVDEVLRVVTKSRHETCGRQPGHGARALTIAVIGSRETNHALAAPLH